MLAADQSTGQVTINEKGPATSRSGPCSPTAGAWPCAHSWASPPIRRPGLIGASCYIGAYAKTINVVSTTLPFTLSPPDMDEATVAVLRIVNQNTALGDRNTTGFQRVSAFKKGYFGGLTACN